MPSSSAAHDSQGLRVALLGEAEKMALYISLTLLAALAALPDERIDGTLAGAAFIWAAAAGLALVHWLTFDVAPALLHSTPLDRAHRLACPVTIAAALGVALVATIPLLVAPEGLAPEATIAVLTAFLATMGYIVARLDGKRVAPALGAAATVVVIGALVVAIKLLVSY